MSSIQNTPTPIGKIDRKKARTPKETTSNSQTKSSNAYDEFVVYKTANKDETSTNSSRTASKSTKKNNKVKNKSYNKTFTQAQNLTEDKALENTAPNTNEIIELTNEHSPVEAINEAPLNSIDSSENSDSANKTDSNEEVLDISDVVSLGTNKNASDEKKDTQSIEEEAEEIDSSLISAAKNLENFARRKKTGKDDTLESENKLQKVSVDSSPTTLPTSPKPLAASNSPSLAALDTTNQATTEEEKATFDDKNELEISVDGSLAQVFDKENFSNKDNALSADKEKEQSVQEVAVKPEPVVALETVDIKEEIAVQEPVLAEKMQEAPQTLPVQEQEQKEQKESKAAKALKEAKNLFSGKSDVNEEDIAFLGDIDAVWNDRGSAKQKSVTVIILCLLIAFVLWASWATVDELTRGQGQVIASSRTQVITHLEGGILMDMLVTEGVIVDEGQVLARIENVAAESVLRDNQNKIYQLEASIQRLQAELAGTPVIFSDDLILKAPQVVALQQQVFETRQQQFLSEMSVLDSQVQQAKYELDELEKRLRTAVESVALTQRRVDLAKPMVERGLYAEVDYLNLQQEIVNLKGEAQSLENNISKAQTVINEADFKKELFKSEYDTKIIAEVNELTSERNSLQENLAAGTDRVTRTEIRSPMRGVVNRIVLNTKGSAVRPGEPIMEVVPLDDTLLIEAKIRPADIGFIYPNQNAVVKLTAYDFSIFGGLDAKVEQISADTIQDGPNQEYFYLVKLRTTQNSLEYRGETLPIIPGMIASVDIITGKKTIMQYLLKPILKAKDNALRER